MNRVYLGTFRDRFINAVSAVTATGRELIILGQEEGLPDWFDGADIDVFVDSGSQTGEEVAGFFHKAGFAVQPPIIMENYRAFGYCSDKNNWIFLDFHNESSFGVIGAYELLKKHSARNSLGLLILSDYGLIIHRIMKYVLVGSVSEKQKLDHLLFQVSDLDGNCNNLAEDLEYIAASNPMFRKAVNLIQKLFSGSDAQIASASKDIWELILERRRQRGRPVLDGKIQWKHWTSLLGVGRRLWSNASNKAFPIIALVGIDGSGKTTICEAIKRRELIKANPLHIVMRRKDPMFTFYRRVRPSLELMKKRLVVPIGGESGLIFWFIEISDYFDRLLRYTIARIWAGAGAGPVIFERYPTDRLIKGGFGRSLFPLERFFPRPNLVVLLDVDPADSVSRKIEDNHNYQEQFEKRHNYIKFIASIDRSEKIPIYSSADEAIQHVNEILWKAIIQMQEARPRKKQLGWVK